MTRTLAITLLLALLVPVSQAEDENDSRVLRVCDVRDFGDAGLTPMDIVKSIRNAVGHEQALVQLAENGAVVIRATPAVQEQVAAFLSTLRKKLLAVVLIEARVLQVAEGEWRLASGTFPKFIAVGDTLDELRTLREKEGIQVLSAPRILVVDGQRAEVRIGSEVSAVADLKVKKTPEGGVVVDPKVERTEDGIRLSLRPILSVDGEYMTLVMEVGIKGVSRQEPGDVGNRPIPPINEVTESRLRTSVTLPRGSMVLLDLGRRPGEPTGKRTLLLIGAQKVEMPGDAPDLEREK